MTEYIEEYQYWQDCETLDEELRRELDKIRSEEKEIEDRFYRSLEFGTGGLRGLIGAGTNRMNIYTVRKATQGLANYIKKHTEQGSVAIAYDSRNKSQEFAEETAKVLAQNGIVAHLFKVITPTPILSFAVRELKCTAGVVITASHNPKEYNGYKVYWSDGGQITDTIANGILVEISKIEDVLAVQAMDFTQGLDKGLIRYVDDQVSEEYLEKAKNLCLQPELIREAGKEIKIVFSPLHGTGNIPIRRLLSQVGFENVFVVAEQEFPDGNFPTVKYPNPEEKEALSKAIKLAQALDGDIVMATDPDADRVGVAARNSSGEFEILTGNQLGALMLNYMVEIKSKLESAYEQKESLKKALVTTIVSSRLGEAIAEKHGVETIKVLTGFKYIGEKIKEFEEAGTHKFLFGYEESYGYLIGDFVRDKDAVQACLLIAEMSAYYKQQGQSLWDRLYEVFNEYGYYEEALMNYSFAGIEGQEKIRRIMWDFRKNCPESISDTKVAGFTDYYNKEEKDLITGKSRETTLPQANVVYLTLEDGTWICVRPSGTEPKLKIYIGVRNEIESIAKGKLAELKNHLSEHISSFT